MPTDVQLRQSSCIEFNVAALVFCVVLDVDSTKGEVVERRGLVLSGTSFRGSEMAEGAKEIEGG